MTFYPDAEQRYHHDARYKALVDMLFQQIVELQLTPGEIRDAAMLAALKFERMKPPPTIEQIHAMGVNITGGKDARDFVEEQRGG